MRAVVGGAAAVVLLVALAACSGGGTPAASFPPSVEVTGAAIPYDGLQPWSLASIPTRSSRVLTVFATGSDRGGGPCGPPVLRLSAVETDSEVRVSVAGYQEARGADPMCAAIAYSPSPYEVRLRAPLGDRRLVDARSGRSPRLLVSSDYPDVPNPPKPFRTAIMGYSGDTRAVSRAWSVQDGAGLTLLVQPPASVRTAGPYGRIVRQTDIGGSPATVYRTGSGAGTQRTVQWTPNARQTISVRLDSGPERRWTDDQAVAIARSVTGYRTTATTRLPVPSVPGTAAAVYSSADGPVLHEPNLLKSSGVYVGVVCQGRGAVYVALRGAVLQFTCAAEPRQFVRESVGAASETFFLDVSGDRGVRWSVVLARASLDGS
ncbi:hypothetical protein [uncultured Amnibacterium sp.]|uniref:hypothetical protein n=1 Tax=uncultured Amnibacterium sp. TaxID=1631851 RepID=UPI0035CB01A6